MPFFREMSREKLRKKEKYPTKKLLEGNEFREKGTD
jgi:hypothetical protein